MKIISNNLEVEVYCKKCESIFIAEKGEYKCGTVRIGDGFYKAIYCECPVCNHTTYQVIDDGKWFILKNLCG